MPEFVPCDLCGADEYEVLNDKAEREKQGILHSVVIRDGEGNIVNGRNVICKHCGLVYVNPRMTREELDHFYRHDYRKIYGEKVDYEAERRHADVAIGVLFLDDVPMHGSLLDIGCSTGQLLAKWKGEAYGIEPNERNCKIAQKAGQRVENVSIEDYTLSHKVDVIVMLNTLEHVLSPKAVLAKSVSLLDDGGYLLVSVPHFHNTTIHIPVDAFLSNAHLYQFDILSLLRYFREAGLKKVRLSTAVEEIGEKLYLLGQKTPEIEPEDDDQTVDRVALAREYLAKARHVWAMKVQTAQWGFR